MEMMINGEDNIPRTFVPSLKIKIKQLEIYRKSVLIFYFTEIGKETIVNIMYPWWQPMDEYGPMLVEAYFTSI
jgi:hypothetical protein